MLSRVFQAIAILSCSCIAASSCTRGTCAAEAETVSSHGPVFIQRKKATTESTGLQSSSDELQASTTKTATTTVVYPDTHTYWNICPQSVIDSSDWHRENCPLVDDVMPIVVQKDLDPPILVASVTVTGNTHVTRPKDIEVQLGSADGTLVTVGNGSMPLTGDNVIVIPVTSLETASAIRVVALTEWGTSHGNYAMNMAFDVTERPVYPDTHQYWNICPQSVIDSSDWHRENCPLVDDVMPIVVQKDLDPPTLVASVTVTGNTHVTRPKDIEVQLGSADGTFVTVGYGSMPLTGDNVIVIPVTSLEIASAIRVVALTEWGTSHGNYAMNMAFDVTEA